jgi:hypothetical protein
MGVGGQGSGSLGYGGWESGVRVAEFRGQGVGGQGLGYFPFALDSLFGGEG